VVLSEPVLVGRKEELKELQRSLDSVLSGKGKTIFISGEAGSGKTRLITEDHKEKRRNDTVWMVSE
jgi:predicted ATPase